MTINNTMFAGTAVAPPPTAKAYTFTNDTNFFQSVDNTQPYPNTPEPITADNIRPFAHNNSINKPKENFDQTLRKTVKADSPHQNQKSKKPDQDEQASAIPPSENAEQPFSTTEVSLTFGLLVKENTTKTEQKNGRQLTQLIANLNDGKSSPVTGQATKSVETKLLVNNEKEQIGLKSFLPNTSKDQLTIKTVLPNMPERKPTADKQPGKGKKSDKISVSNGTALTTKAITNKENVKELLPDASAGTNNKATEINENSSPVDIALIADSTKSSDLNVKNSGLDTLVENDSKKTKENITLTDNSPFRTNEKTAELKPNFSQVHNKIIEPKSQTVGIAPEKSTTIHNATTDSKTIKSEILSESSNENNKETSPAGNKLTGNPAVQVSTNQSKNNNGAASNNNSNSEFQQIINQNNPETPATELIPNSAEGAKDVELPSQTSPGSTSASVGQQIQESVRSSFTHEGQNQQITIQLNPPELGKVLIKFQEQDNHITGLLEVSKTQTRIEIEQAIPQIIKGLQDSGIQIKRLDVTLSHGEQPDQGTLRDSASGGLQNGWAQQQYPTDSYTGRNNLSSSEINELIINNNNNQYISQLQEALTTDGSINMLI